MVTTLAPSAETVLDTFELRGNNRLIWDARDGEIMVEGMSGTGKTRTILELINQLCHRFSGMRALIVRHHQVTLTTTCLVTFNEKVLKPEEGVRFFGGSKERPAAYNYPNRSQIVVGGLDNADKILSSEYDLIYANEATELGIEHWETLTSRLRNGVLKQPRIIGDCNPVHETHWLNKRCEAGKARRIVTRIEDNPAYYYADGTMTEEGAAYIAKLDALTGSRYKRFRLGEWAGVENAVHPQFRRDIHIIELPDGLQFRDGAFGADYGRVHKSAAVAVSVDQYGRRWVREAWGRPSDDHGALLVRRVGELRQQYSLRRGRVDPNQDHLAGSVGASLARSGEGSRQSRINMTGRLFNVFPNGIVPAFYEDMRNLPPRTVSTLPDSPGLFLVKGAPGIDALAEQLELYHYQHKTSDTKDEMVVARVDEDLVAALEYAIEELEHEAVSYDKAFKPSTATYRKPRVA